MYDHASWPKHPKRNAAAADIGARRALERFRRRA